MDHDTATGILQIVETSSKRELIREVKNYAIRYARIRTDWTEMDETRRKEEDASRTRAHNALIDSINILSREMGKSGEDISWRQTMGDDRKEIGDFACHMHAILGVRAR